MPPWSSRGVGASGGQDPRGGSRADPPYDALGLLCKVLVVAAPASDLRDLNDTLMRKDHRVVLASDKCPFILQPNNKNTSP